MTIKDIFDAAEGGILNYEQFCEAVTAGKAKFVDLSEGNYVSKQKFDDELAVKVKEIETLNGNISTRDTDLAELQKQLEAAGGDAEKLAELTGQFDALKGKYDEDIKSYKAQLKKQQYEFAVREFANGKGFSSQAAKRDFIQSMLAKDLKMEDGKIIGADDFATLYAKDNEDAFMLDDYNDDVNDPNPETPQFISPTPGGEPPTDPTGGFASAFHFTPIHPMPANS